MLRKMLFASCVAGALFCVVPDDALGHGGTYRGPGDVQGPPDPGGPSTGGGGGGPPTGGGGGGPTTGGGGGPTTPGGAPPGGAPPGAGGKGPTTGGAAVGGKKGPRAEGFESWQFWWEYNKDRFINVRERLAEGNTTSGTGGFLTGGGKKSSASSSSRPSADEVNARIVPLLKSVLGEDDMDIVDSAVLALGRIVNKDSAAICLEELKTALGSKYNSVQQSTILAMGVLGSKDAVPTLIEILNDTADGRKLLKVNGKIQDLQRSFAALALGYIGSPDTIPVLKDAFVKADVAEKSIRGSVLVGLGLFNEGKEEIITVMMDLLKDEKLDEDVAGQIPVALGRLGAESALPTLLKLATGRKTNLRVEESSILALAQLAQPKDKEVVAALFEKIKDGQNDQARHFSIMALADITERALKVDFEGNRAFAAEITKELLKEMTKAKQKQHEPWSGLALSVIGRNYAPDARERLEIAAKLDEKFTEERNPSYQPAYAVALGILNATTAAANIQAKMLDTNELNLKGFCAIALGMMKHAEAKDSLRKFVLDDRDPKFRLQVATALGLMGDVQATDLLVEAFRSAKTLNVISSLARAIGLIGDGKAIDPLEKLVADKGATGLSRGFGCVALGLLAEKSDLPWNARVSIGINYRTQISALREVLDIL
jgi:HEAT repeat protein